MVGRGSKNRDRDRNREYTYLQRTQMNWHRQSANTMSPTRLTVIKTDNNRCWWGCRESGTLIHCWWEYEMVQLMLNSLTVSQNVKQSCHMTRKHLCVSGVRVSSLDSSSTLKSNKTTTSLGHRAHIGASRVHKVSLDILRPSVLWLSLQVSPERYLGSLRYLQYTSFRLG